MSTYKEMFKFNLKVVDFIKRGVRQQISHLSLLEASIQHEVAETTNHHKKIIELMPVLGNLDNQKTRYDLKYHTEVTLG